MSATFLTFKSRRELEADELISRLRGKIVVCKTIVPGRGWKRRRWITIDCFLDGSNSWHEGMRDENAALFVAGIFSKKYGFPIVNLGVLK